MKRTNWVTRFPLGIVALVLFVFAVYISAKKDPRNELLYVLENFRGKIFVYHQLNRRFAVLKSAEFDFWDLKKNQYIWETTFAGGPNTPEADRYRNNSRFTLNGSRPVSADEFFRKNFFNPITGKFDWLAEDASGTLYSPTMPDSILIASPPIRVVNIRCPLTASDPPYFEDFTKW